MDTLTPRERSARMALIRSKNSKPELKLRRLVHGMGYRYRLHRKDLPGKPDMVFVGRKKVIFMHGCFWHLHRCKRARMPSSRQEFWRPKLEGNKKRDRKQRAALKRLGWDVLVIWECELNRDDLEQRIRDFMEGEAGGVKPGKGGEPAKAKKTKTQG